MGLLMGGIARRYAAMELEGFRVAADAAAPPPDRRAADAAAG